MKYLIVRCYIFNSEEIPVAEIVLSSGAALFPHHSKVHFVFTLHRDCVCFKSNDMVI